MKKNVNVICDLQFGSCGKGLIAGYLAKRTAPDTLVTAWGPNSGHTFVDGDIKYVHCMLANGVVSPNLQRIMIAPASQINVNLLRHEFGHCRDLFENRTSTVKLVVHKNAAMIQDRHVDQESGSCGGMTRIGSTKKGCGACAIEKIQRRVDDQLTVEAHKEMFRQKFADLPILLEIVDTEGWVEHLNASELIQVEGSQGFSLGMHSGFFPYTTSRECTVAQILSDCLISPAQLNWVVGVMRTFPIRVANRYNERGEQIGWSGPVYSDQREISWEMLGIQPEITTVTRLVRRVFTFSEIQMRLGLAVNAPTDLFLNFLNQIPENFNQELGLAYTPTDFIEKVSEICLDVLGRDCNKFYGWGPDDSQVMSLDSHPVED